MLRALRGTLQPEKDTRRLNPMSMNRVPDNLRGRSIHFSRLRVRFYRMKPTNTLEGLGRMSCRRGTPPRSPVMAAHQTVAARFNFVRFA
jgi:hypothetical protein